jgi:hypothetical protein
LLIRQVWRLAKSAQMPAISQEIISITLLQPGWRFYLNSAQLLTSYQASLTTPPAP